MRINYQRPDGTCGTVEGGERAVAQFISNHQGQGMVWNVPQPIAVHNEEPLPMPRLNFGEEAFNTMNARQPVQRQGNANDIEEPLPLPVMEF